MVMKAKIFTSFNKYFKQLKDALENKNHKLIFISTYKNENIATIKITDNGGGIDEKIIEKICEPYFTTKHQSKNRN